MAVLANLTLLTIIFHRISSFLLACCWPTCSLKCLQLKISIIFRSSRIRTKALLHTKCLWELLQSNMGNEKSNIKGYDYTICSQTISYCIQWFSCNILGAKVRQSVQRCFTIWQSSLHKRWEQGGCNTDRAVLCNLLIPDTCENEAPKAATCACSAHSHLQPSICNRQNGGQVIPVLCRLQIYTLLVSSHLKACCVGQ